MNVKDQDAHNFNGFLMNFLSLLANQVIILIGC